MTESLLLVPFVLPDKLFHNQGSHSKSWAHLGQSAPCGRGQPQLLCYHEAMTALFNNFAFVFLCRTVKTSRHSSKQTKTENAKCCTLKTIWAKRLFALKPREQPTNTGDGWWRMGCRNWSLLGVWERPRVSGWWALCLLGAAGGGLPSSPFHAREGGMLGKDVRGGKGHVNGHLPKTDFICFEDLCFLFC